MSESHWTDNYIRPDPDNPGKFICYDERGEFLDLVDSEEIAIETIIDYAMKVNGFRL